VNKNMATEAQKRASAKYDAKNTKALYLKLNVKTDADILDHLDQMENKQGYIKELIRQSMKGVTVEEPKNKIIEGIFAEGETVIVLVDGEKYKRKVRFSKTKLDPVVTILSHEYREIDFQ
jgi:hypothetical protein